MSCYPCFKCFIATLMLLFVCVCVSQVSCARLSPTWTGRPKTSIWFCFRLKTWEATWEDYLGPPLSLSGSLTSTTILHASLKVSYPAAHAATHRERMTTRNRHNRKNDSVGHAVLLLCTHMYNNCYLLSHPQSHIHTPHAGVLHCLQILHYVLFYPAWSPRLAGLHLIKTMAYQVSCQSLYSNKKWLLITELCLPELSITHFMENAMWKQTLCSKLHKHSVCFAPEGRRVLRPLWPAGLVRIFTAAVRQRRLLRGCKVPHQTFSHGFLSPLQWEISCYFQPEPYFQIIENNLTAPRFGPT